MYNPSGVLNLSHSEVSNSYYGVRTAGTTAVSASNIHNTSYGVYADSGTLDLTDTTFSGNYYADVHVEPGVTYTHSGNTYSGGQNEGIFKSGTLTSNETWNTDTIYVVTSTVTVANGVTLTIEHGAIVKFGSGKSIVVNGALDAQGTAEDKIYFTSDKDDSSEAGGDTNGDGGALSASSGNWAALEFDASGSGTIAFAVIRYGGSGNEGAVYNNGSDYVDVEYAEVATSSSYGIHQASGTAYVNYSSVHNQNYGIYVTGGTLAVAGSEIYDNAFGLRRAGGTVSISDSAVHGNTSYGVMNAVYDATINAENNWWGSTLGPHPTGGGDWVTDYVDYDPWHHVDSWWSVRNYELSWFGSTQYTEEVNTATSTWGDSGDGMSEIPITHADSTSTANLIVQDLDGYNPSNSSWAAWITPTSTPGVTDTITFSIPKMGYFDMFWPFDMPYKEHVALHELGHALGLGHSDPVTDTIMYSGREFKSTRTSLADEDKGDYHFLWTAMHWIVSTWWP